MLQGHSLAPISITAPGMNGRLDQTSNSGCHLCRDNHLHQLLVVILTYLQTIHAQNRTFDNPDVTYLSVASFRIIWMTYSDWQLWLPAVIVDITILILINSWIVINSDQRTGIIRATHYRAAPRTIVTASSTAQYHCSITSKVISETVCFIRKFSHIDFGSLSQSSFLHCLLIDCRLLIKCALQVIE